MRLDTSVLGRRSFIFASVAFVACKPARVPPSASGVSIWSCFDLPKGPLTNELSGLAWDASKRVAYAVQDKLPNIVTLVPDDALRTWRVADAIEVDVPKPADLEALALLPDGFLVVNESGPHIYEIDRAGHVRRELPVPPSLRDARENKSLESIAITPDGRFIFTANEGAAPADGPLATDQHGTCVRIVRIDRETGALVERKYMTDRAARESGDWGVSDLVALSSTDLLVLERGWSKGYGNSARVYRASLDRDETAKDLLFDLATLDTRDVELPIPKEPQPTPLLDNFEGITLGPRLSNGASSLVLVSDDNTRPAQVARVLVVAWTS